MIETKEERIQRWMNEYGASLLKVCVLYLSDYTLAEDAVQETFFGAWRAMDRFEGRNGCSEKTWLTRIAVNVCGTYRRTKWFRHVDTSQPLNECSLSARGVPEEAGEVLMSVTRLPEKYRMVIILYYYHGMNQREIAEALGVRRSMVSYRLRRGLKLLKIELE